ncbi:hypothetical protein ACFE04_027288 [Oxalis oulophora]
MQSSSSNSARDLSMSRSFCSSTKLADVAARVVQELQLESSFESQSRNYWDDEDDFYVDKTRAFQFDDHHRNKENNDDDDDDGEFEFSFNCKEAVTSPISADEIFHNGQIKPMYANPTTTRYVVAVDPTTTTTTTKRIRSPLKQLLIEERETSMTSSCSSSSSDDDELDGVEAGSFCVWTPKKGEEEEETEEDNGRGKKSNLTGLKSSSPSKRWKFKSLLYNNRSNSDGKDNFSFMKSDQNNNNKPNEIKDMKSKNNIKKADSAKNHPSYLPYRQELVGIFSNVNGLSRNLHPF